MPACRDIVKDGLGIVHGEGKNGASQHATKLVGNDSHVTRKVNLVITQHCNDRLNIIGSIFDIIGNIGDMAITSQNSPDCLGHMPIGRSISKCGDLSS